GPMNLELHDAQNAHEAFRLCITPAPESRPSCQSGHTGILITSLAPSAAGTMRLRFTLPGGRVVDRSVQVVTNATAQHTNRVRILRAALVYERSTLGAVIRLDRAL